MNNPFEQMIKSMQEAKDKLEAMQGDSLKARVVGESGGGLVKVTLNGKYQVVGMDVDKSIYSEGPEVIEELISSAFNKAVANVAESNPTNPLEMISKMGFPNGFKFPA